jgi:hypothetical protein
MHMHCHDSSTTLIFKGRSYFGPPFARSHFELGRLAFLGLLAHERDHLRQEEAGGGSQ